MAKTLQELDDAWAQIARSNAKRKGDTFLGPKVRRAKKRKHASHETNATKWDLDMSDGAVLGRFHVAEAAKAGVIVEASVDRATPLLGLPDAIFTRALDLFPGTDELAYARRTTWLSEAARTHVLARLTNAQHPRFWHRPAFSRLARLTSFAMIAVCVTVCRALFL